MATATTTFSFTNTGNFVRWATNANGATGVSLLYVATVDSPNDTSPTDVVGQFTRSGKSLSNGAPYAELNIGPSGAPLTWEDLGVPAGATVTAVACDYDWQLNDYTTGAASSIGPMELRDAGGTNVRGTFSTALTGLTAVTAWATRNGTAITGLSDASNTQITFRLWCQPNTGSSNSARTRFYWDWAVITVTYTSGASFTANVNDTVTMSDAITSFGFGRGIADTLTMSDSTSKQETKELTPADTVVAADALALGYGEAVADSQAIADSLATNLGKEVTPADSVTVSDGITQESGKGASINDSVAVADALALGLGAALADTVTMSDAQAFQRAMQQTLADSVTMTDATAQALGFARSLGDSVTMSDVLAAFGYGEGIADSVIMSDAQTAAAAWERAVADSVALADAVRFDYMEAVADAVTLADAQAFGRSPAVTDTLVIVDAAATGRGVALAIADAFGITDNIITQGSGVAAPYVHMRLPLDGEVTPAILDGVVFLVVGDGTVTVVDGNGVVASYEATGTVVDTSTAGEVVTSDEDGVVVPNVLNGDEA